MKTIFPVVLSFDKEIAFGNRTRIKRGRGNNGGGKKSIFPVVGCVRCAVASSGCIIFSCHLLLCATAAAVLSHRDPENHNGVIIILSGSPFPTVRRYNIRSACIYIDVCV